MWVRFSRRFTWTPPEDSRVSIAYSAGPMPLNVRQACGEAAIAAGRAEAVAAPARGERAALANRPVTCDGGRYFWRGWRRCGRDGCHPFGCTKRGAAT